jgi:hypothetical protein
MTLPQNSFYQQVEFVFSFTPRFSELTRRKKSPGNRLNGFGLMRKGHLSPG